jgi:hypothetical protein
MILIPSTTLVGRSVPKTAFSRIPHGNTKDYMKKDESVLMRNVEALTQTDVTGRPSSYAECLSRNGIWAHHPQNMGNITFDLFGTGEYNVEGSVSSGDKKHTGKVTLPWKSRTKLGKKYGEDFVIYIKCEADPASQPKGEYNWFYVDLCG